MNIKKKYGVLILCLITVVFTFTACEGVHTFKKDKSDDTVNKENELPQQTLFGQKEGYGAFLVEQGVELPVSRTSIYVDEAGYVTDREKKVIFCGGADGEKFHGNTFDVVRCSDNAVVYTGTISSDTKDGLSGLTFGTGDFSKVSEPGTYYIYTDIVGQSYPFEIADDMYENLFIAMLKNVSDVNLEKTPESVCDVSFGMHVIMHALQCNGSLFEEAYKHLDEGEQDKQLVAQLLYMAKWMISQQGDDGSIYGDYEATAAFCGAMSMSRDRFGKYEATVANEYKQAAVKAWKWLENQECNTDTRKSALFYAAAQLFSSEGSEHYRNIAEEYLKEKKEDYSSERFVFYGVLAYISSSKNIDRDLCTYIMMDMVERTENICEEVKNDSLFGTGVRSVENNISNMLHLSFVNYLTPSKEYTVIIENTIQYIGGLNESGICYMGEDGKWRNTDATLDRNFEWNGIMLLGMSDMLKNFNEIE